MHVGAWNPNNNAGIGGMGGLGDGNRKREYNKLFLDEVSDGMGTVVNDLGVYQAPVLGDSLSPRLERATARVLGFTSPEGLPMHFSYMGNVTNTTADDNTAYQHFRFGFGNGTDSLAQGDQMRSRQQFNQEFFTGGGIDIIINDNVSDGDHLRIKDYPQMYDEVSCYVSKGMDSVGHFYQIYDNIHEGTIAGGAVAPFRAGDHWSWVTQMYYLPLPVKEINVCNIN
ncbi:hypothetical protein N431DRAFT_467205 [Stipitochalara longipes BDJ]|nr:hypothetical protein N431DRAFT_467205 [Stipitochalara longipes BDJ]